MKSFMMVARSYILIAMAKFVCFLMVLKSRCSHNSLTFFSALVSVVEFFHVGI